MKINSKLALFFLLFLTACNTTNQSSFSPETKLGQNKSRLIFDRPSTSLAFLADARIYVNGSQVSSVSNGGRFVYDVNPGIVVISVDNALNPGQFKATFKVESGKTVKFKIVPNTGYLLMGVIFGIPGLLTDIAINQNSGVFTLEINQ